MAPIPEGSLPFICDSVLIRSILTLRHALDVLEQEGFSTEGSHVQEVKQSLKQMEAEAQRRGIFPEGKEGSEDHGFLRGLEMKKGRLVPSR